MLKTLLSKIFLQTFFTWSGIQAYNMKTQSYLVLLGKFVPGVIQHVLYIVHKVPEVNLFVKLASNGWATWVGEATVYLCFGEGYDSGVTWTQEWD